MKPGVLGKGQSISLMPAKFKTTPNGKSKISTFCSRKGRMSLQGTGRPGGGSLMKPESGHPACSLPGASTLLPGLSLPTCSTLTKTWHFPLNTFSDFPTLGQNPCSQPLQGPGRQPPLWLLLDNTQHSSPFPSPLTFHSISPTAFPQSWPLVLSQLSQRVLETQSSSGVSQK